MSAMMMAAGLAVAALLSGRPSAQEASDDDRFLSGYGVTLRGMDKLTARTRDFDAYVGETARFGALRIETLACRAAPPLDPPEAKVYLKIRAVPVDAPPDTSGDEVFSGWMFASDPAANPLEHAVYDVWPIACITASPESDDGAENQSPGD